MKIQLDTAAMNAMFPEGSEARVELQQAVIANFVTRIRDQQLEGIIRSQLPNYGATSETELRDMFRKMAKEHLTQNWGIPSGRLSETSTFRTAIDTAVKDKAGMIVRQMVDECLMDVKIQDMVNQRIEKFKQELETTLVNIDTRIRQRVLGIMDEIIRIELSNAMELIKSGKSALTEK